MPVENTISIADKAHTLLHCTIEILTKCNWRCEHCYIPKHDSDGLSLDVLKKIFRELRTMKTFELILTGGEMFLRNDIMDILSDARQLGFNLQLFTNLSLLSEKSRDFIPQANIEKISCTIFSLNPDVHDAITNC
ncbi:MAG: radical SAM protein [Clostridium sp.]|jgi:MoaA/NifB/PqqE/SkfB family radical SAM enzyme|nr:radical SAM protein [Clostridium sp.]